MHTQLLSQFGGLNDGYEQLMASWPETVTTIVPLLFMAITRNHVVLEAKKDFAMVFFLWVQKTI